MRDELLLYYERELTYLRQMGAQFGQKYPKIASRLSLEPSKCDDPHVERLLEGFAFLAARVHLKIDDEFPEITEALLDILYPHFVRPLPSMSIVEFQLNTGQGRLTTGLPIPRNSLLYSRPVAGIPCKFRTCYDTTIWPVSVTGAEWISPDRIRPAIPASDASFALRLRIASAPDLPLPRIGIDHLRFHLTGESSLVHALYELLGARLTRIIVRDPVAGARGPVVTLPASHLRPVGFEEDEAMIPYPRRSFQGYRLLQEYFSIPEKFFFVDVTGLEPVWQAGFKNSAELIFLFSTAGTEERRQRLENGTNLETFRLNCSPIINLFPQTAEPILLDQRKPEYQVIPDIRRPVAMEIFSVDHVSGLDKASQQIITYRPFYSFRSDSREQEGATFWIAHRRESTRAEDEGSDVHLSLVDRSMRTRQPDTDNVTVRTTCTNRSLPSRLPFGNADGDFEIESSAPIQKIVALRKPTAPLRPPRSGMAQWHLVSHLSLNHLSLVEEGREALQNILRLYDFTDSAFTDRMIEGIARLDSRPHFSRLVSENGVSFVRGKRIEIDFDEEQFVGGGIYLFASVLERFFAMYASMNSFTQLIATTRQKREVMRQWPPRAGSRILV
ncbi:MAG: type VI secretion system baseplate subunit TssF [Bryobacteraceae bacterium]|nr:type VI secretion system baseplate subunit TssF [Bryobacteraceae bacterium]